MVWKMGRLLLIASTAAIVAASPASLIANCVLSFFQSHTFQPAPKISSAATALAMSLA